VDEEITRLENHLRELKSAWAEFEHQARRYGDARERAGGVLREVDADVRQLYRRLNSQNEGMASSSPPRGRLLAMAGRRVR